MLMRPNDEFYVYHRLAPEQIQIFIFAFRHPLNEVSCCCYALTAIAIYIAFDLLNLSLILLQLYRQWLPCVHCWPWAWHHGDMLQLSTSRAFRTLGMLRIIVRNDHSRIANDRIFHSVLIHQVGPQARRHRCPAWWISMTCNSRPRTLCRPQVMPTTAQVGFECS
jgi:hypothetical protein